MILFVNSCVRKESRTERLARRLLEKLGGEYTEINLEKENLSPLTEKTLKIRTELLARGEISSPAFARARQFADADIIVIAAPFWDMSFPASLKIYIENICVMGIASVYDENGVPHGLCKAKKLYYVTTAGGKFIPDFGYEQIKALAENYFGIPETILISAENLDIDGSDPEKILSDVIIT